MKDYMLENQNILEKWENAFNKNGGDSNSFSYDGIMFRGKISYNNYCQGRYYHEKGNNENELWENSNLKILYLTKDQNTKDGNAWDDREITYHKPWSNFEDYELWCQYQFHRNIVRTLYGLVSTTPEKLMTYEDIDDSEALKLSDEYPFAKINCKKEAGGASCPTSILVESMEMYSSFLEEQIKNLNANIIICCGNQNDDNEILNFLCKHGYNFKWNVSSVWYDEEKNVIAIDAYHLSHRCSNKSYYDDVVGGYYNFLKNHPDFIKS
ncbi:MAG TPA: hypothetical protein PKZ15_09070 [Paludibacteraceae bacterium]|nr:hypothetical protein [Paludibacteraceae bacterium]